MAKATKQDFLLAVRKATFTEPGSFGIGGRMNESWFRGLENARSEQRFLDSCMTLCDVKGDVSGCGLQFAAQTVQFRDYPVSILNLSLHNPGAEDVHVDMISLLRHEFCGEAPMLVTAGGEKIEIPAPPPRPKERPATPPPHGHRFASMPRFEEQRYYLSFEECTVLIDYAGSKLFLAEPMGASLMIGQHDLTLKAGETLTLAPITLAVCEGDVECMKDLLAAWGEIHG